MGLIREQDIKAPPPRTRAEMLWALTLIVMIVLCIWVGLRFYDILGLPAILVMGTIAALAGGAMFIMLTSRPVSADTQLSAETGDGLSEVFQYSPNAALITVDGKIAKANAAYIDMAKELGLMGGSGAAPTIDQLFVSAEQGADSAIFRLHHLDEEARNAEEVIEFRDQNANFRAFHVQVTSFGRRQHWLVKDLTNDQERLDRLLSEVPIGLFSVDQDGKVIATNTNLDMWIGGAARGKPEHMREFIDNPAVLLGSPRTPGRIVRADTRLVTRKGVVTPTVLVAAWREAGPDYYIANVALHGHSSFGAPKRTVAQAGAPGRGEAKGMSGAEFAAAPFAILELDHTNLTEARIHRANAAFEAMTDMRDWRDRQFSDIFKPGSEGLEFLQRDARACSPEVPFGASLIGPGNLSVSAYIVADPASDICRIFLVDVSARKSLEDQLVQSQKMQAVGRLVAEIAHDFNNLLAAMRLYTDTLLGRHPIGDPSYPELQQINSNVNRAASLVKKLLAYSRKQTLRAVKLDVTETLSDITVTLKQMLGERVSLDVVHGRDLPPIKVDKSQLDTVLMNLTVNARDAMKAQGGGQIMINSRAIVKSNLKASGLRSALDGIDAEQFVAIAVIDTGTGITDEIKNKIFEPFFTTKAQGEGTGLGLSTVYGIVQQSGGYLDVESELGVGTTFTIYLPAYDPSSDEAIEAAEPNLPKAARRPADLAGQGNILFVEDEDSVRVIAAKTLRKRGYNVVEACDGEEAFEILEDTETPFDLMISDVVMPGMDGPTLLKKGRSMLGDARIVFISGYAEEEFSELLSEEPDVTFLPKPFSLVELAEKVKAEIGEVQI